MGRCLRSGGIPLILDTAKDNLPDLRQADSAGLEADVLLVSGGVSMGKYDLVEPVFEELGVTGSLRIRKHASWQTDGVCYLEGPLGVWPAWKSAVDLRCL